METAAQEPNNPSASKVTLKSFYLALSETTAAMDLSTQILFFFKRLSEINSNAISSFGIWTIVVGDSEFIQLPSQKLV